MAGFMSRFATQHKVQDLLNEQATFLVQSARVLADMVAAGTTSRIDLNRSLHQLRTTPTPATTGFCRRSAPVSSCRTTVGI